MSIEIQKPELERRVREAIQSGRFHDVDESLSKALETLSASARPEPPLRSTGPNAVESIPWQG
jgi:Arc/MetJ-type ribon-helix-helix transcriptional regulator